MIFKWKEGNVGTSWKPPSLAYTTFLCYHLLPRHQLSFSFHIPFLPHAIVTASFKVCHFTFDRSAVTLKWLALAYCTFISERWGTFLNCGVFSISFFWRRWNMLLLWFALIKSPVSSYSLLCACLLQPKRNTLDFGKIQQHICKEFADSEIFLVKVS